VQVSAIFPGTVDASFPLGSANTGIDMRIDFGASYTEVSKLLRASADPTPKVGPGDFARSLGAMIDASSQPVESKPDLAPHVPEMAVPPQQSEDIRASYRFPEPTLEMPQMTPQHLPVSPEIQSMIPQTTVKTPTVVDVQRVEVLGDLTKPKNAVALGRPELNDLLRKAGQQFDLNPKLAMAVVQVESGFNTRAVSTDGHASKGLFQLLDETGKGLLARGDNPGREYDPFDPNMNVELGASYLRYLHDIFSKPTKLPNDHATRPAADNASLEKLAVAAFNAGEGRVASAQTRAEKAGNDPAHYEQVAPFLPASTREYVAKVIGGKKLF